MMNLIRDGGFPMLFVFAFGAISLAVGAAYAARPSASRERFVWRMSLTTASAMLVALAADLGATFHHVSHHEGLTHEQRVQMAMMGVGESMAPLIVGFGMLTLVALLAAIGRARFDARRLPDES